MTGWHWGAIAIGVVIGLFLQSYFNPLGKIGLG